jgi:hypothetical protein
LKVGNIFTHYSSRKLVRYSVQSIEHLVKIIQHFDLYPLITQKLADYILFKEAYNLILNKQHLTLLGLRKIVAIKASLNNGLSDKLKAAFAYIVAVDRPLVQVPTKENLNFYWYQDS